MVGTRGGSRNHDSTSTSQFGIGDFRFFHVELGTRNSWPPESLLTPAMGHLGLYLLAIFWRLRRSRDELNLIYDRIGTQMYSKDVYDPAEWFGKRALLSPRLVRERKSPRGGARFKKGYIPLIGFKSVNQRSTVSLQSFELHPRRIVGKVRAHGARDGLEVLVTRLLQQKHQVRKYKIIRRNMPAGQANNQCILRSVKPVIQLAGPGLTTD